MKFENSALYNGLNQRFGKHGRFGINRLSGFAYSMMRFSLILGISLIILFPIFNIISMSIKAREDLFDPSVFWIPRDFSWNTVYSNLKFVINFSDYWQYLFSTCIFVVVVTACHIASSCVIGYGFAKFRFKGNKPLFSLVLLVMLVPPLTTIIPQYLIFSNFDLFGLIKLLGGGDGISLNVGFLPIMLLGLTGFGLKNSLFIYIFRQFFANCPKELDEAAYVDGCGVFKTFFFIGIPLAKSAAMTVGIFSVVWEWTDSFYTYFYGENLKHLISELFSLAQRLWHLNADGSHLIFSNVGILLCILPVLLLYIVLQKFFTQSIERSGLVG